MSYIQQEAKTTTTELDLYRSQDLRAKYYDREDALEHVGKLELDPYLPKAVTRSVAALYQVKPATLTNMVYDHRDEFDASGLHVLAGQSLNAFKAARGMPTHLLPRKITLWPKRSVLLAGMLLRDSPVAKKVRCYLLDIEENYHIQTIVPTQEMGMPQQEFELLRQILKQRDEVFSQRLSAIENKLSANTLELTSLEDIKEAVKDLAIALIESKNKAVPSNSKISSEDGIHIHIHKD